jgi:hypothetical protein
MLSVTNADYCGPKFEQKLKKLGEIFITLYLLFVGG